jgi:hypothetical protein
MRTQGETGKEPCKNEQINLLKINLLKQTGQPKQIRQLKQTRQPKQIRQLKQIRQIRDPERHRNKKSPSQ